MSSPFSCSQLGSRRSSILPFFPSFFYAASSLPRIDNLTLYPSLSLSLSLSHVKLTSSPSFNSRSSRFFASFLFFPLSSFPPLLLFFLQPMCFSRFSRGLICLLFDPNYDFHGRRIRTSDREKNSRALDRESERTIGQQSDVRRAR